MMMFSFSTFIYIATVMLALPTTNNSNLFAFAQKETEQPNESEAPTLIPITPSYHYDMYRNELPTCFDYRKVLDIDKNECTWHHIFDQLREAYETQAAEDWALKWYCHGGLTQEMITLTGVESHDQWQPALEKMCASALKTVVTNNVENDVQWNKVKDAGVNLEEYFAGGTFLNEEHGNLQNIPNEFERRGGYERYFYIGEDPRLNDYFPTTEESYQAAIAINETYYDAETKFLSAPPSFNAGSCSKTSAAMCCWSKDRQYNDNNGGCSLGHCINQRPGDNTDLCWIEEDSGDLFPYPNPSTGERERDLHCHGLSWSALETEENDDIVNDHAKWNNLYYVSLYDHLYKRGYVDSITDAPDFLGDQPMCGCVEEMPVVARADCTEAYGKANYTVYQDQNTGLLQIEYKDDTFEIEYQACDGWEYTADVTPQEYQESDNIWEFGLRRKTNDLSALVFRQYLEGKTDTTFTDEYEQTVVGYKYPQVNNNDDEREQVCKAAFEAKFPGQAWEKFDPEEEEDEE